MLNCFLSHRKTVGYGKEVSMQDREQARLEWLNRLQQPQLQYLTTSPNNAVEFLVRPRDQILVSGNLMLGEQQDDPTSGFVKFAVNGEESGLVSPECRSGAFVQKQPLLRAASRLPSTVEGAEIHENVSGVEGKGKDVTMMKMEFTTKRKVEFVVAQEWKDKRIKRDAEGVEPVVGEKSSGETPADLSKENSKAREFQKPDYIHVRARRGQATDSHSLAERARREKINKKMKTLQDLVPGCSIIVGRAGVLDEIINYVQSLQRQVEFLSMKLAALNPKVDFNPEEFPAYVTSFPAVANLPCLQLHPVQQRNANSEQDVPKNPSLSNTIYSIAVPKPYPDSSFFSKAQSFPTSETNLPKIYNVEFN